MGKICFWKVNNCQFGIELLEFIFIKNVCLQLTKINKLKFLQVQNTYAVCLPFLKQTIMMFNVYCDLLTADQAGHCPLVLGIGTAVYVYSVYTSSNTHHKSQLLQW